MIRVKISKEMKQVANDHQKKMTARFASGGNYTGVEFAGRWYLGKMGELAFWYYLLRKGARHEYTEVDRSDDQDFLVYVKDRPYSIDVKSSNGERTNYMGTPEKRFRKDHHDIYVGVRVNDDTCEIMGYLRSDEMKYLDNKQHPFDKMFKEPNYGDHYDNLKDIKELLKIIDKDKQYE